LITKEAKKEIFIVLFLFFVVFIFLNFATFDSDASSEEHLTHDLVTDATIPTCNGLDYKYLSNFQNADIENLEIKISDSNAWYKNLIEAYSASETIKSIYKTYFPGSLKVNYTGGIVCHYEIEVRLSGDWKDHIDIKNLTNSFDIKIIKGNILGVTNFKLFLPNTRNGDNEIYLTTILENFGFLVPRTFYVDVISNEFINQKYIFQEKFNKEFLEFNSLREGPIIETNETYFWDTSTGKPFDEADYEILTFGKVRNKNWSKKSESNEFISLYALSKYNAALNSNTVDGFLYSELNKKLEINTFDAFITALQAEHLLANHNRVFYYDRLEDLFRPIYYDGNSNFLSKQNSLNYPLFDHPGLILGVNNAISIIKNNQLSSEKIKFDLEKKGVTLDLDRIYELNNKLLDNLYRIKSETIVLPKNYPDFENVINSLESEEIKFIEDQNWVFEPNSRLVNSKDRNVEFIIKNNENYEICNQKLILCETLNFFEKNIFNLNLDDKQYIFGLDTTYPLEGTMDFLEINPVKIKIINNAKVKINNASNEIEIIFTRPNQKVVFLEGSVIQNYLVSITSSQINESTIRSDRNLLTGCVTFYRVEFEESSLKMNGSHCEDSVNIIGSSGKIKDIFIDKSDQDALDIDFSELHIEKVSIKNSGNDCLDISGSNVTLNNVLLLNCFDKGLSIGENSKTFFSKLNIKDTSIGVAVKDLSSFVANFLEIEDSDLCVAVYQKKQEFGPASAETRNFSCENGELYIQKGSFFEIRK